MNEMICPCCGRGYRFNYAKAIEFYYRSRGPGGSRKTLRQVADQYGLSYEAFRKQKQRYDRAGKWGAKHKKVQP